MKLSELRNGMLVQCNNSEWHMVIKDSKRFEGSNDFIIDVTDGSFVNLKNYDKDMENINDTGYSIAKVAQCRFAGDVIRGIVEHRKVVDYPDFDVIWERTDPKVAEVESLIAKLQGQLAAAQDELGRLR